MYFCRNTHFTVFRQRLTQSLSTTATNVHDITETENLLHGEETFILADSGYRGAQKREELKDIEADWLIALFIKKGKQGASYQETPENKQSIRTEYLQAGIRAKVEHSLRIIQGFTQASIASQIGVNRLLRPAELKKLIRFTA
ncbi:transposase [Amphritea sp. 1_MG-2023]|uniref:transposase n=1 Tax=Amphritea sp. 1_MG-2023 TaxID=3062670 RepID=UPI0026E1C56B|nr:transposase [Amphritea sp. 1_MG-2023]MDO6563402.1 transposase [Amphritea sp. 1_MG-2023]